MVYSINIVIIDCWYWWDIADIYLEKENCLIALRSGNEGGDGANSFLNGAKSIDGEMSATLKAIALSPRFSKP